jgi:ABC-2 type transport system ATP-binding protein
MAAVEAEGLVKIYRSRKSEVRALDGVDLEVREGTVLGLLGPNGAGKTTTVRILATLLKPNAGTARVAGFDVLREPQSVRKAIGLSGQYAAVDENLTGRENLWMFGRLYHLSSPKHACAQTSCWSGSSSTKPPTASRRRTPAACAGGSTSPQH